MVINFLAILPVPMMPAVLPYISNPKDRVGRSCRHAYARWHGVFPVKGEHEGNGVFRHRIRGVGGNTYDGNTVFRRCFQVYIIISGAAQGKELHSVCRHLPDDFRVGRIVYKDTHRVHTLCQYHVIQVEMPLIITKFKTVFTVFSLNEASS